MQYISKEEEQKPDTYLHTIATTNKKIGLSAHAVSNIHEAICNPDNIVCIPWLPDLPDAPILKPSIQASEMHRKVQGEG